jgi:hypothetical protein
MGPFFGCASNRDGNTWAEEALGEDVGDGIGLITLDAEAGVQS